MTSRRKRLEALETMVPQSKPVEGGLPEQPPGMVEHMARIRRRLLEQFGPERMPWLTEPRVFTTKAPGQIEYEREMEARRMRQRT